MPDGLTISGRQVTLSWKALKDSKSSRRQPKVCTMTTIMPSDR